MRLDRASLVPHRFRRFSALLLGALLLLMSCAPAPAAREAGGAPAAPAAPASQSAPKVLRIAMQISNEPSAGTDGVASPAPYGGSGAGSAALEHFFTFHSNMTVFDSQRTITPRLAEKIPALNDGDWRLLPGGGMEVTWKLKPNLVWHDGTPLSAEDFVFGFQVARDPALSVGVRVELPNVAEVKATDDRTFVVTWKTQSINGNVNGFDGVPPLPRHIFKELYESGDKGAFENSPHWSTQWVGLGPFRLTSWSLGSSMEGAAFDRYVLGKPKIDRLIIRYMGDVNALVANVMAGEIDLIPAGAQLDINQMVTLKQAWDPSGAGFTLLNTKSVRTLYLQFRDPSAPWASDLRVRQALLHALNRDEIVESLLYGMVPRADYYIPKEDPVFGLAEQRGLPKYAYDMTRAERLLADAGWTRGADRSFRNSAGQPFSIDVMASGQGDNVTEAVTVAGQWSASGFQSQPIPYPANAENAAEIRHNMKGSLIWPWNFTVSDPRTVTASEVGAANNRWRGGNYGGYVNRGYEALYEQLSNEVDPTKRTETQFQMVKHLAEELPVLPIFYRATGLAARKGVEGPTGTPPIQAGSAWNIHTWDVK
jgi:peptide/nickel transport system substrate-binding protein